MNRTTHGLNSVRLLVPTEDAEQYRTHVAAWLESFAPVSAAERQLVLLLGDMAWRLQRIARIEERRAATLLEDLVQETPEWATRVHATDLAVALDAVANIVGSTPVPVSTRAMGSFFSGLDGVGHLLDALRDALQPEKWPEGEVVAYMAARKALVEAADREEYLAKVFGDLGLASARLRDTVQALDPGLQADVDGARAHLATTTLLVDAQDRQIERHRRLLEASMGRQLDLLGKVRAAAQLAASSGSYERAEVLELRVIGG